MNCQSIKNKIAELHTIIDLAKPDIILGNESWLTPDIKNSDIFSDSFDAVRKDRTSDAHGVKNIKVIKVEKYPSCCIRFSENHACTLHSSLTSLLDET